MEIEQLQRQSAEHYEAARELRRCISKLEAAVFGNGNPDGAIVRRLKRLEEAMNELHDWITREDAERAARQKEIDKRDRAHDRKLNILMAFVAVIGVVTPLVTAFVK